MIPPFPHQILAACQPFSGLDQAARQALTHGAELRAMAEGDSILLRPGPSLLLLVDGQGLLKDSQGNRVIMLPGELAGFETLVGEPEVPTLFYVAKTDGHVLLFPQGNLSGLLENREEGARFVRDWLSQAARRRVEAFEARQPKLAAEGALWRQPLRELSLTPPLWAQPEDSVAELARLMRAERRFAALVGPAAAEGPKGTQEAVKPGQGGNGQAVGIVTERDVLLKVVAAGLDPKDTRVADIMTSPVASLDLDAPVFEAVAAMVAKGIRRLAVRDGAGISALVEESQLMALRGANPVSLAASLATAKGPAELAEAFAKTAGLASRSMREGVSARQVARLVSTLHGHLLKRAAELCLEGGGRPSGDFCVLALGAEGRGEAFLATDQDNALVFADTKDAAWAESFGPCFSELLARIGYPDCPEGIMVGRPGWRGDLPGWQARLERAVAEPDAKSLVFVSLLADARCVAGSPDLAAHLGQTLARALSAHPLTLRYLAREALRMPAPLGFLGNIQSDRDAQGRAKVDLKRAAVFPLTLGVKALALRFGIASTSSFARIEELAAQGHLSTDMSRNLLESLDFVLTLRLRAQSAALSRGEAPGNLVDLADISRLERDRLREALKVVMDLRKLLESAFSLRLLP